MTTGTDNFSSNAAGLTSPIERAFAITPHDTNELSTYTRAIYVGGAGNLTVVLVGDSAAVTYVGVPAGTTFPRRVKKVLATGTTATNLVGEC